MIKIIKEEDVFVTKDELNRYIDEYRRAFMFYCGSPISFETFVKRKKGTTK